MTFPTRLNTLLSEGRISVRSAAKFEFGTGTYGIWNGKGDVTFGGTTYTPNCLIEMETPPDGLGTGSAPIKMKMPARTDFGVTPDRLLLIENEDYKGRPVTLFDLYFDPDDGSLLHFEPIFYGYVDTIPYMRESGEIWLEANIETSALDNHRDGYRTASTADQQLVSPGDLFFEHAATIKNEYFDIKL